MLVVAVDREQAGVVAPASHDVGPRSRSTTLWLALVSPPGSSATVRPGPRARGPGPAPRPSDAPQRAMRESDRRPSHLWKLPASRSWSSGAGSPAAASRSTSPGPGGRTSCCSRRAELTSGSTHHAAGLVTQFNPSSTMMRFRRYSVELYRELRRLRGRRQRAHRLERGEPARAAPRGERGRRHRARGRADLSRRGARAVARGGRRADPRRRLDAGRRPRRSAHRHPRGGRCGACARRRDPDARRA